MPPWLRTKKLKILVLITPPNLWDAHQCLSDICSGRARELLAQGVSTGRFNDKTPDQEKAEKRRYVYNLMFVHMMCLFYDRCI